MANQASPTALQFLCTELAIDTVDGWDLSNETCRVLLPKKSKVMPFNQLYITNKTERFSFISGRAMRVSKLIEEDWSIELQHRLYRLRLWSLYNLWLQ